MPRQFLTSQGQGVETCPAVEDVRDPSMTPFHDTSYMILDLLRLIALGVESFQAITVEQRHDSSQSSKGSLLSSQAALDWRILPGL